MLLLLILALLAMFAMIGIAFVLLTSHSQRAARVGELAGRVTDSPKDTARQAFRQIIRGSVAPGFSFSGGSTGAFVAGDTIASGTKSGIIVEINDNGTTGHMTVAWTAGAAFAVGDAITDPTTGKTATISSVDPPATSVVGSHSILEDLYGNGYLNGTIVSVVGTPGQLVEITTSLSAAEMARHIGCVLTITGNYNEATSAPDSTVSVPDCLKSTRVVGVNPATGNPLVLAFPDGASLDRVQNSNGQWVRVSFLLNSAPFSGAGFGYNPASGQLDLAYTTTGLVQWTTGSSSWPLALLPNYAANRNPAGGANSDYTAPDFQHMFLGAQAYDATRQTVATLPSFHRPSLVNYWKAQVGPSVTPDFLQSIMFRPIGPIAATSGLTLSTTAHHPQFTGSNPNGSAGFDPINGPWDVDNDGDGVPDSVWLDLGLPVRTTSDGKQYKPLAAVLCVDMDGRLNLNAHGSLAQADAAHYGVLTTPSGGATAGVPTVRGQGVGPAEINLTPLLATQANVGVLLSGNGAWQGRYGLHGVPGIGLASETIISNQWFEYAAGRTGNYWDFSAANNAGSFASPPDPFGVGVMGLDLAGRPVYGGMSYGGTTYLGYGSSVVGTPYEINLGESGVRGLVGSTTGNSPFSAAELERLLRPYDKDAATLPVRLAALTSTTTNPADSLLLTATNRKSFTTESWDVPCPSIVTPQSLTPAQKAVLPNAQVKHISDLLVARGIPTGVWATILPPDLLAGRKMNINRPFGNGLDDNGNHTVDEYGEANALTLSGNTAAMHYDETGADTTTLAGRQREARCLYVLMCLTCDLNYLNTQTLNGQPAGSTATARYIAQWAVNAVDFKSRDSIMTRFDYDPNYADPTVALTSWNPTETVWGCKKPELLISETLAFHDRRTKDTTADSSGKDVAGGDANFDQSYRPQGSLFVELYCPTSPLQPRSGDLYTASNGNLELSKLAGTTTKSPVWRLAIAVPVFDGNNELKDPDNPTVADQPTIEREVYFVSNSVATLPPSSVAQFYPSTTGSTVVRPGGYAVIGSGEAEATYQNNHPKRTYLGFRNGATAGDNNTRYIDLSLTTPPLVRNNTNYTNEPTAVGTVATLAIDSPHRLSVSEPLSPNYDSMQTSGIVCDTNGQYVDSDKNPKPYNVPFDVQRTDVSNKPFVMVDGTTEAYRVIYLQRLANPLLPHDDTTNPYRTVDAMTVDLTAFNGITSGADVANGSDSNPIAGPQVTLGTHLQSRQRGENNDEITSLFNTHMNLWKQEPVIKTLNDAARFPDAGMLTTDSATKGAIQTHYFTRGLKHSLGYLNQPFGTPQASPFAGDPALPFPWLAWNNRPYTTPLELLQVPTLQSSKLLVNKLAGTTTGNASVKDTSNPDYAMYFDVLKASSTSDMAINPYLAPLAGTTTTGGTAYSHTMNFLGSTACTGPGSSGSPQFHRILEYLNVPSPFIGTETWLNPTTASSPFRPPFNRISAYREPGRINLNTIYDPNVFYGLMAGFPDLSNAAMWQAFAENRRGGPFTGTALDAANEHYPTEFAKPYRSYAGGTMVPPVTIGAHNDVLKPAIEIDATLLRSGGVPWQPSYGYALGAVATPTNPTGRTYICIQAGNSNATEPSTWPTLGGAITDNTVRWQEYDQPLFSDAFGPWVASRTFAKDALVAPATANTANGHVYKCIKEGKTGGAEPSWLVNGGTFTDGAVTWQDVGCDDPNRNPYFRYQALQRLGNLVTTRSNVFAIWITVGYFEVKPWGAVDAAHPDGYQLGAELGSDTGEVERHRAFYMYDRTLPVGFQRGQDLNVDKAILTERFIE